MVDAFATDLGCKMSLAFPLADVHVDGGGVSLTYKVSGAEFVHGLVDFTCLDEHDIGLVAVHARPDHVFQPHWEEDANGVRTLIASDAARFEGGDGGDGHEFEDGLGNTVWTFEFPRDAERIAALAVALAGLSARHFE